MKNKLLLLVTIASFTLSACNKTQENIERIGIISALDVEVSLLLDETKIDEEKTVGGVKFYIGRLKNKPVVISRAGIGKVRAGSGLNCTPNPGHNRRRGIFREIHIRIQT